VLANVYLLDVFDIWIEQWRRKQAGSDVIVVRFCDDFVVGFQYRRDAERFIEALKERFIKFAFELNEGKTRLIGIWPICGP
jgi:hypothetical protein